MRIRTCPLSGSTSVQDTVPHTPVTKENTVKHQRQPTCVVLHMQPPAPQTSHGWDSVKSSERDPSLSKNSRAHIVGPSITQGSHNQVDQVL